MKIVQVCPYDINRSGGVQRHMLALADALRARGHEVLTVAPGPSSPELADVFYLGCQRQIGLSGTRFELTWAAGRDLRRLQERLKAWNPDILHFHTLWSPMMPFQVFRRWYGPVVVTFHDTPPPGLAGNVLRFLFKAMSRWILTRVGGAIAVSSAPMAHLRPGCHGVRPVIIPPAVDLKRVVGGGRKTPFNDGCLQLLFVGRLERRKGIAELLQAWDLVQQTAEEIALRLTLTIAGKGEFAGAVRDAQRRLGPDRLQFVEAPDDDTVRKLYGSADMFLAPSTFGESFGIVLVEAMANGLPIIAAANAGYASILVGPASVGLVPPGNVRALADKIISIALDEDLRKMLATWGMNQAGRYDVRSVIPAIESLYDACVSGSKR